MNLFESSWLCFDSVLILCWICCESFLKLLWTFLNLFDLFLQQPRRGNLESRASLPRTVCVWFIGAAKCDRRPAPPCPEPAVCVCESPSLRQQEPYSVPLLGKKGVESLLWIDVAATPARELRVGSKSARTLCAWFIGAAKCDAGCLIVKFLPVWFMLPNCAGTPMSSQRFWPSPSPSRICKFRA